RGEEQSKIRAIRFSLCFALVPSARQDREKRGAKRSSVEPTSDVWIQLGEHHRAEPHDGPVGGGEMQVYVRLGIRLLYKGASSRMEGGRARRPLKSLSIKQDIEYDDPESAKELLEFIEFHGLKVDEILDPLNSFKTFNQFYRKLKPSARPIECPTDPYRLVSAADCCLMTFATVSEATRLWIKGCEFSVARLLGEHYKAEAERYVGGALAIFRLAPQDYHRFHSPVHGKVGVMMDIEGEYYTVIVSMHLLVFWYTL
ncbi:hypothetical protein CVT25_008004, partial [Psilocybe cyanescens]